MDVGCWMGKKLSVQFCAFCEPFRKMEIGCWMWFDEWKAFCAFLCLLWAI